MTIFEVLAKQHGEVEALFREVKHAAAGGNEAAAHATFQTLSTQLIACMRAEHAVVYPRFAFLAGLEDEVARAIREHDRIEQAINSLRLAALPLELWQAALTRLQALVTDHVETEEWILFPVARLRLTREQVTQIAVEFAAYQPVAASVAAPSITYFVEDAPCSRAHRDTEPQTPAHAPVILTVSTLDAA